LKAGSTTRIEHHATVSTSSNSWNFAYNVGAGVSYAVSEQLALDLGYRYYDLGSASPGASAVDGITPGGSVDVTAHELSLALRFSGF
jgi:opacity protein-like surface antigen